MTTVVVVSGSTLRTSCQEHAVKHKPAYLFVCVLYLHQAAKEGKLEGYEALMVYVDVLLAQVRYDQQGYRTEPRLCSSFKAAAEHMTVCATDEPYLAWRSLRACGMLGSHASLS